MKPADDFENFIKENKKSLEFFVLKIVENKSEVDDLVMEIFEKAFLNIDKFRPDFKIKTWLFKIARNHCIDYLRKKKMELLCEIRNETRLPTPEDLLISKDQIENVYKAIDRLNSKNKTIIELHLDGFKNDEIAEKINLTNSQVRVRISNIKKTLRQKLTNN